MKLILSFFVLISCCSLANAQTEQAMPFDDRGKFIHYEVVELKNTPIDSLKLRMVNYFKRRNSPIKFNAINGDTAFIANGKFIINKTLLVMSHPSGEVLFQFQAQLRDHKYRFWLTDFSFIPYVRDRYSNFVPATTVSIPLENDPGKLNAGQWKEYQTQTAKFAKELADKFKAHMMSRSTTPAAPMEKKVVKKDW